MTIARLRNPEPYKNNNENNEFFWDASSICSYNYSSPR